MTTDTRARTRTDTAALVAAVLLVALGAWWWLASAGAHTAGPAVAPSTPSMQGMPGDHSGHHHDHGGAATGLDPAAAQVANRLAGWAVMVVAMMLPPALPLLQVLRSITRRRAASWALTALGAAAFVAPWVGVGVLLVALDWLLGVVAGGWADTNRQWLAGGAAIAAGVYQFTPAKRACLTACRSPRQLALTLWRGDAPATDVARIGGRYGLVCVGCCWALMLLTLAVGWPALPVMVVMALVMAAERVLPAVRAYTGLVAVAAIVLGLGLLAGIVPAGSVLGGH